MEKDISARLTEYAIIRRIQEWREGGRLEEDIMGEIDQRKSDLAGRMTCGPAKEITDKQLDDLHQLEVARAYLTVLNLSNEHDQNKLNRAMNGEMIDGSPKQSTVLRRMRDKALEIEKIPEVSVNTNRRSVAFNFGSGT